MLTLQKDSSNKNAHQRRINIKKILSLDDMINKPYKKITIELYNDNNLKELNKLLKDRGKTEVNLIINQDNKKIFYNLQNLRKFDFNLLKTMKTKEYVKKITV